MKTRKTLSTARKVCARLGGRSLVWLWRQQKRDPAFPRPIYINGQRLFDDDEVDAYVERMRIAAGASA